MRVRYSFGSRHTGRIKNIKKQRGKYPKVMKDVVEISDIILEILDARFVEETRNHEVEGKILDAGKILVYVINKSDLVDRKKLEKNLPKWMKPYVFVSATKNIGLSDLKARVKMEAKRISKTRSEIKDELSSMQRIHVGVIGYPNAGKSSVINFITKKGAAKTAKQAGFTRGMQKIRMSEGILILDTPGVIPEDKYSTETNSFAEDVKVGARTYSDVKNPEDIVFYLIRSPEPEDPENTTEKEKAAEDEAKRNSDAIDKFYEIDSKGNVEVLIEKLGKKLGHLGKGGKVDTDRTARVILRDWQEGKIHQKNSL